MAVERLNTKEMHVCILAHNEQRHIGTTIRAISAEIRQLDCGITVYANGCTDSTCEIVDRLTEEIPNLVLRELVLASKPAAWNTAFQEHHNPLLVFSDGDIVPEVGAISALRRALLADGSISILAGCSLWPRNTGLTLGQQFTGFLQIPLRQTYLAGGLYALRRDKLAERLQEAGLNGMPSGLTADDAFIESLVPQDLFRVVRERVFYEPPPLKDYWKYLARIRWQNEQLCRFRLELYGLDEFAEKGMLRRFAEKVLVRQSILRTSLGLASTSLRFAFKTLFARRIRRCYVALGAVDSKGQHVLTHATRSASVK